MAKKEEFFVSKTEVIEIHLYAVRNKEGKWLRSKGQNGYGESWVDEFARAKVWNRPGPAKAQVTFWGTHYPKFGIPDLVEIVSGTINYLDQTTRVEKALRKKILNEASNKVHNLEYKINNYIQRNRLDHNYIDGLKADLDKARNELAALKAK